MTHPRTRPAKLLTMSPEAWERLDLIASRAGLSRSAMVETLVRGRLSLKAWDVYAWTRATRTASWIGNVRARHEPQARQLANVKFGQETQAGTRYILRPKGETWGMPCKVVREDGSVR